MSLKANGLRASPPAVAAAAARRRQQPRRQHRGLGLALLCLLCYSLLRAAQGAWWAVNLRRSGPCQADNEGSWSIGIFKGPSPLQLEPLEQYQPRQDTHAAWPAANPVLTCASVTGPPSNFVADPFLLQRDGKLYLFYETKAAQLGKGQIGVAVSSDGGASFQHLGVALDLPWHLSYPFVFEHGGQVYMLPEGSGSGRLTLYRAAQFPLVWEEERVLVPAPLVDASLVEWHGRWYLLASDLSQPRAVKNGNLNVWHAESPLGPWEPHPLNPVANGPRAAGFRNGGRLVVHEGRLYRFGQDCGETYGHKLVAYEVTQLSPTAFDQRVVPHSISGLGVQRKRSWISARHHHIDAQQLPSGEWIAAIDGDSLPSGFISQHLLKAAMQLCVALVCGALWLAHNRQLERMPSFRQQKAHASDVGLASMIDLEARASGPYHSSARVYSPRAVLVWHPGLKRLLLDLQLDMKRLGLGFFNLRSSWRCMFPAACRLALAAAAVGALIGAALLHGFIAPYRRPAAPVPVQGQHSQFTLLCMTYEARMSVLRHFVRHYSRCPSVSEIVLVWNNGKPPQPERDFDSAVPVRVRVEPVNSLNNRFRLDPLIRNRAVLSLDDDIMLPCSDLEHAFALWRAEPDTMVGFYPRLIHGQPLSFHGESHAVAREQYNVVLTGAAFMDSWAWPAYWTDAVKSARDTVDALFNGEDILMNFVLANASAAAGRSAAVHFVRPTRRVDISKLSGVGISHSWDKFLAATRTYLDTFTHTFGGVPLRTQRIDWRGRGPPHFCTVPNVGCMYL